MKKLLEEIKKEIVECDILLRELEQESKCFTINVMTANLQYEYKK